MIYSQQIHNTLNEVQQTLKDIYESNSDNLASVLTTEILNTSPNMHQSNEKYTYRMSVLLSI